jgi:calcineurin-like phosphoesterase family protein
MKTFFTSDLHFKHSNIKYSNRPFKNVDEMDEALINNWNSVVSDKDSVYICGDIGMCKPQEIISMLCRLKGNKHLIYGNHDEYIRNNKEILAHFSSAADYKLIKIKDEDAFGNYQRIALLHYPMIVWDRSHYGTWHLHGHCHGSLKDDINSLRLDVGVDAWYTETVKLYRPVEYSEIKERMKQKSWKPVDRHGT